MICETVVGRLEDLDTEGKTVEYVPVEWHEAFKKIHRKETESGREVGIRMDDSILSRGLYEGDVIYLDEKLVIAVHTPPCEVLVIQVAKDHPEMVPKICYEIGNRHAPLFYGEDAWSFLTPYNEPILQMVNRFHGVEAKKVTQRLYFEKRISSSIHNHHH